MSLAKQSQLLSHLRQKLLDNLRIFFLELLILCPQQFINIQILIYLNILSTQYLKTKSYYISNDYKKYFIISSRGSSMFFYVRNLPGNRIQVKLNQSYILQPSNDLYGFMQILVPLIQNKNQLKAFPKQFQISLYSSLQMQLANKKQQTCLICIQPIFRKETIQQQLLQASSKDAYCLKCLHVFHKDCLEDYINTSTWFNCPKCLKMHGKMVGDMPEGMMTFFIDHNIKCEGYNCSTIVIKYEMFGGVKNKKTYQGADFMAFLPNNQQGQDILKMFQECFRRKLTFTIKPDKDKDLYIDWAQIPHKTALNNTKKIKNGYPDPQYISKTKNRIIAFGIKI